MQVKDGMTEREVGEVVSERLGQRPMSGDCKTTSDIEGLIPEDMVLGIGFPCSWPYVPKNFMMSFIQMITACGRVKKHLNMVESGPLHCMRNSLVMGALDSGCTHLLMVDADARLHENVIPALARHRKPIVGALCFKRWLPFSPTLYTGEPGNLEVMVTWPTGLVEVTATGAHCLLIDLAVVATLEYPWFRYEEDKNGKQTGEDIGFCFRAREKGIPVYVDTTCEVGHLGIMDFNRIIYKLATEMLDKKT